jgi:hypothetical protein
MVAAVAGLLVGAGAAPASAVAWIRTGFAGLPEANCLT